MAFNPITEEFNGFGGIILQKPLELFFLLFVALLVHELNNT